MYHGTVAVQRTLNVPVAHAYNAFSDANERAKWGAPSDNAAAFIYEEANFKIGGRDLARCGPKDDPRFTIEAHYVDIVPERRVVWVEMVHEIDRLLAVNITTLEFFSNGDATELKVTVQVTSFVGPDMIKNTRAGHEGALSKMARYLE